jgi:CRP/FNR family transcriptional regulator, cyclic AMP receptor protein
MSERKFQPGEVFFRPGDVSDSAYLIQSGQVEILFGDPKKPSRSAVLGPGMVFGEMALVEERPHSATARAVTAGVATSLGRAEFERDLLQDPAKCRAYLRNLFERLRQLSGVFGDEPVPPSAAAKHRVLLRPLTRKTADALPDDGLSVTQFPFRIGRASESREREALDLNELWLLDRKPFTVSRNHLSIDRGEDGGLVVIDRGSHLGAIVNDLHIGGKSAHQSAPLDDGENVVILGGSKSPYQFRVTVESGNNAAQRRR